MNHPTKLALSLFVVGLLTGGCNQNFSPPPPPPGSGNGGLNNPGLGGQTGEGGTGGSSPGSGGGTAVCNGPSPPGCVSSCTTAPFQYFPLDCQAGTWTCPSGSVSVATCAPNSCAQYYQDCCNDVTGETTPAPCSSDGLVLACADGLRNVVRYCVPAILGISSCMGLDSTPCDLDGQRCHSSGSTCTCGMTQGTDAGLTWFCPPFIP